MKKLILLCDYGMDDAIATLALLKYKHLFSAIDILPVGGNVPERTSFENAKKLLNVYEGNLDNVRVIDTLSIEQPCEFLDDIHGGDGMGSLFALPDEWAVPVLTYDEWIDSVEPQNSILVSLGPCTVTQMILERHGAMELLFMGDHVAEEPNYKIYEFNYGINPASFDYCLKFPHVCGTLDTCHNPVLDFGENNTMIDPLMHKMVDKLVELGKARGFEHECVYDYCAVCYLIFPERYTTEEKVDPFGNKVTQLKYISDEPLVM